MKTYTRKQLEDILGTSEIGGTPRQIEGFAIRVAELAHLNGENWVRSNAQQLVAQWHCVLGVGPHSEEIDS